MRCSRRAAHGFQFRVCQDVARRVDQVDRAVAARFQELEAFQQALQVQVDRDNTNHPGSCRVLENRHEKPVVVRASGAEDTNEFFQMEIVTAFRDCCHE